MNNYYYVVKVSYCELQHLLKYSDPIAYTCGQNGWNADVYEIDNVAIVTGYFPFGNIIPEHQKNNEYNNKAMEISSDYPLGIIG